MTHKKKLSNFQNFNSWIVKFIAIQKNHLAKYLAKWAFRSILSLKIWGFAKLRSFFCQFHWWEIICEDWEKNCNTKTGHRYFWIPTTPLLCGLAWRSSWRQQAFQYITMSKCCKYLFNLNYVLIVMFIFDFLTIISTWMAILRNL